ncbi:hypothetical protein CDO52_02430 [Nocardiopsis gilva YIM 90087]|uniref:Uncharacterized protein n=1 Tax=Nocardiopsis gilva YIM 90087 TaxID=1235441 RepID=A0A223S102_9ACTN|nr:DUF6176 family protein [Nocardiopsis gilva]ASU81796.1 hypothetical protein CDO52_02430 [Nocardiopsis gilva YIM 90087]
MPEQRPATFPPGLNVELTRHRIRPGRRAEFDAWMRMLEERQEECVATLDVERMAVECVFSFTDENGDWIFWLEISGEGGGGLDADRPIDRDHAAYARRAKIPGHERAEPRLLLLPEPVREAIMSWAVPERL